MARGVNKVILIELYQAGKSIPQVAEAVGLSRSTVRYHLQKAGVLRDRAEGVRMAAADGRMSANMGVARTFTDQWRRNISAAKRRHAYMHAVGESLKPSGYIEITRGRNKGRGQHRVVAEKMLCRELNLGEVVHHIDGDRSNNSPENLQVMTRVEHARHHAIENSATRVRDQFGRFK